MLSHFIITTSATIVLVSYLVGAMGAYWKMRALGRLKPESVWIGVYWPAILCSEMAIRAADFYVRVVETEDGA